MCFCCILERYILRANNIIKPWKTHNKSNRIELKSPFNILHTLAIFNYYRDAICSAKILTTMYFLCHNFVIVVVFAFSKPIEFHCYFSKCYFSIAEEYVIFEVLNWHVAFNTQTCILSFHGIKTKTYNNNLNKWTRKTTIS